MHTNNTHPGTLRMDTHVHSSASSAPAIPALALINCPECCSPPEAVYDQARARGMTHITLTDHDTLAGALELKERNFQDLILGEEVTTRFPEDAHPIHCLVWNITPEQHEELTTLNLRTDIYAFAHWLKEHNLAHAIAHPLDGIVGTTNSLARIEHLALLFRGFELLNGAHAGAHSATAQRWVNTLTPDRLESLSTKHNIKPIWPVSAPRAITAGSDDHALLNVGTTFTAISLTENKPATTDHFLAQIMSGDARLTGPPSTPAVLAHQFISVATHRYAKPLTRNLDPQNKLLAHNLAALTGVPLPKPTRASLALSKLRKNSRTQSPLITSLQKHLHPTLARHPKLTTQSHHPIPPLANHPAANAFTEDLLTQLTADLAQTALTAWQSRNHSQLRSLTKDTTALAAAHAPYITSLFFHNKDRHAIQQIEQDIATTTNSPTPTRPTRIALFTDTLAHTNGVSRFLTNLSTWAQNNTKDLHIFTFDHPDLPRAPNIHPVTPIFSAPLPAYPDLPIQIPALLPLLRKLPALQPDAVHVSTPGPIGLIGALAAEMLRAPLLCTHHTDFPAYAQRLLPNTPFPALSKTLLRKLYSRATTIFARSHSSTPLLKQLRVPAKRIHTLPPPVDATTVTPAKRNPNIWQHPARPNSIKALYAGRISPEKNTRFLETIWKHINQHCNAHNIDAQLIIVGDGPDRPRLERELTPHNTIFLSTKPTQELATLYASADIFLFPSTTDTLAQVVLEAQASALPAIVSTTGGPQEIITHNTTGFALPTTHPQTWIDAALKLIQNPALRKQMSTAARTRAKQFTTHTMYEQFWSAHEQAIAHHQSTTTTHTPLIPTTLLTRLATQAATL